MVHRIAEKIARESITEKDQMHRDPFIETVKLICRMASINFMKAVAETGYTEDFYSESQYSSLESAINKVSRDF